MIYEYTAAFMMGFLGSMHCIGMCGGLVGALTMSRPNLWWSGLMSYQAGRVLTYTVLGLIAGLIGTGLHAMDWFSQIQTAIIILTGLMMITFGLNLGGWLPDPFSRAAAAAVAATGLGRMISRASASSRPVSWGMVGLANGLLPCGLVYAALTLGIASGGVVESALVMLAFGAGTIPAMTFVPLLVRKITPNRRNLILRLAAVLIVILGLMMMLKGTGWLKMQHGDHNMHQTEQQMPAHSTNHPAMHH